MAPADKGGLIGRTQEAAVGMVWGLPFTSACFGNLKWTFSHYAATSMPHMAENYTGMLVVFMPYCTLQDSFCHTRFNSQVLFVRIHKNQTVDLHRHIDSDRSIRRVVFVLVVMENMDHISVLTKRRKPTTPPPLPLSRVTHQVIHRSDNIA